MNKADFENKLNFSHQSHYLIATRHVLCDLYSLPSIIRIIKLGKMWWAGHVVRMGEKKNVHRLVVEM
jgi:hypothetical protein